MRNGFTRNDIIITASLIVVLGGLMIWGVTDTRRRSRDAEALSGIKQIQAVLETFHRTHGSYPAKIDDLGDATPDVSVRLAYAPTPENCGPSAESTCRTYTLTFLLEGRFGGLTGGTCRATPENLTCAP